MVEQAGPDGGAVSVKETSAVFNPRTWLSTYLAVASSQDSHQPNPRIKSNA